jgi:hypothetical protein
MAADADPSFEVVTIKPSRREQLDKGFGQCGRRFTVVGFHLRQIMGAPSWAGKR